MDNEISNQEPVWLEGSDGRRWSMPGSCGIGRSATNQVVLESTKVSRRHALIHSQNQNEYWLVDLASSNGTYLNHQRVVQPMLLHDGDSLEIGEFTLVFRQTPSGAAPRERSSVAAPFQTVKLAESWLLLADVIDATMIAQAVPQENLPQVMGRWLQGGKEIIQRHGGGLNKYLGDGFLAFWPHQAETTQLVARAIKDLHELQAKAEPPFRFVVHHGQVAFGISATGGEQTLMGQEVNRVFRMEKLCGTQGQSSLISTPARELLKPHLETFEVGTFTLLGFRQAETFFTV
jgi:adenylate cyclase